MTETLYNWHKTGIDNEMNVSKQCTANNILIAQEEHACHEGTDNLENRLSFKCERGHGQ